MKNARFVITALALVATQANAHEPDKKYYLKVEAGGSFPTELAFNGYDKKKPRAGAVFGFGAGYNINKYLSADVSFNHFPYHKFDRMVSSDFEISGMKRVIQTIRSSTLIFNMTTKIPTSYCITPFFNLGAGFAHNNSGNYKLPEQTVPGYIPGKTTDSFAWNIGAGASFKANEWFTPYVAYKFFDLGKFQDQPFFIADTDVVGFELIKSPLRTHTAMVGLMYNF